MLILPRQPGGVSHAPTHPQRLCWEIPPPSASLKRLREISPHIGLVFVENIDNIAGRNSWAIYSVDVNGQKWVQPHMRWDNVHNCPLSVDPLPQWMLEMLKSAVHQDASSQKYIEAIDAANAVAEKDRERQRDDVRGDYLDHDAWERFSSKGPKHIEFEGERTTNSAKREQKGFVDKRKIIIDLTDRATARH